MNFSVITKQTDILLAIAIMTIIAMLLLPMPAFMLDILITINIALSVTILLVTIYTQEALEYSSFPTILLISTLFRLGLNVSSTRLILTSGDAGAVIHAFGNFVIGGNYLVGILLFIILVVINFIVITNGAGRVAEVAARFTLDAMPGKQLSIDADLNAGIINEQQARERRAKIQKEADFHGTMDGASKFVKGDAIAAIIITLVNIIGGLIVGVFQQGLPIQEAVSHFTILTVGEGLVSQMPALIISTATGFLVTRVTSKDSHLGDEISIQMFQSPKIFTIVACLLGALAVIPGLPTIPFLMIGGICGFTAYQIRSHKSTEAKDAAAKKITENTDTQKKNRNSQEAMMNLLNVEALELEIGYRLVPLLEIEHGGDLLDRITQIRRQMATELGFLLPSVRVRDNLQIPATEYNIKLRGITLETGEVRPEMLMAMGGDLDSLEGIDAIEAREPAFGLPAIWVPKTQKEEIENRGFTVVTPTAVIATHLTEFVKKNAAEIISRQDVDKVLENIKKKSESTVTDVIPDQITVSELVIILQQLLREKVSIRDMSSILDSIGYHARVKKDIDYLAEQCRIILSRQICKQYLNPETQELPVITLSPQLEEILAAGVSQDGHLLAVSPKITQGLMDAISREVEKVLTDFGVQPVLLSHSQIRLPLRRLTERILNTLPVMSYNEIGPSIKAKAVGNIDVSETADNTMVAR